MAKKKEKTPEEIFQEKKAAAEAQAKADAAKLMPPPGAPLLAARLTDMHVCPIIGPGVPTVIIGGLPAAVVGANVTCVGPVDKIAKGSSTVQIGGKPAARMTDTCAHGGAIIIGCPTVTIGG